MTAVQFCQVHCVVLNWKKHVATYTMPNVEEYLVDCLANFTGHHKDIQKSIYKVRVPIAEIPDCQNF